MAIVNERTVTPSAAFASLPQAASSTGLIYSVSDINNSLWRSDGTIWKPVGGVAVLASSAASVSVPADTTEDTLVTITVPANCLGPNGALRLWSQFGMTNSGNNKTMNVRYSGGSGTVYTQVTVTASTVASFLTAIHNRGATNSQVGFVPAASGLSVGTTGTLVTSAVDTTAATTLLITAQKASSGETLRLDRYICEILVV